MEKFETYGQRVLNKTAHGLSDVLIAHYTSMESFLKIIKDSNFRISHSFFMNDPDDSHHFKKYFLGGLISSLKFNSQVSDVDFQRLKEEHLPEDIFNGKMIEFCQNDIYANFVLKFCKYSLYGDRSLYNYDSRLHGGYYILSFSEDMKRDDLLMWRAYADDGKGVKLVFSLEEIMKVGKGIYNDNISCHRCVYLSNDRLKKLIISFYQKLIYDIIFFCQNNRINSKSVFIKKENIINNFISSKIDAVDKFSCLIKDDPYENEKEVRIIIKRTDVNEERYHSVGSLVIPYIDFNFSINSIGFIEIGPRSDERSIKSISSMMDFYWKKSKIRRKSPHVDKTRIRYLGR